MAWFFAEQSGKAERMITSVTVPIILYWQKDEIELAAYPDVNWKEGKLLNRASKQELETWVKGL